jgi:hypothetical protein
VVVLGLTGCAITPESTSTASSGTWAAYRDQVAQERERGALTALQAEEKVEAKYREIYGPDPVMEGAFAYGKRLYAMAEAGRLQMDEADALANARIDEILARRAARLQYHAWLEDRFPPEPSD